MELRSLWSQYVVITDVGVAILSLRDVLTVLKHVFRYQVLVLFELRQVFTLLWHKVSVKSDCPLPWHDKTDLRHVAFLFQDVAILLRWQVVPWHEAKRDLVNKITFVLSCDREELPKSRLILNVLEQELCHNSLLDLSCIASKYYLFSSKTEFLSFCQKYLKWASIVDLSLWEMSLLPLNG